MCNKPGKMQRLKRFILGRKISGDIAAIRSNVESFVKANTFVLADDTHVSTGGSLFCCRR